MKRPEGCLEMRAEGVHESGPRDGCILADNSPERSVGRKLLFKLEHEAEGLHQPLHQSMIRISSARGVFEGDRYPPAS